MDELTFDDKTYVSSKRAAAITGYAKDYIGQLCREGRVQARLVGRNWYVLESSIREHRFGPETAKNDFSNANTTEDATLSTWEAPTYASENDATLPEFINQEQKLVDQAQEYEAPMAHINESSVVQEMQTAWQDWFSKRNQEKGTEEELLETSEVIDERNSEEVEEPITLHSLEDEEIEDPGEENVAIERVEDVPVSRPTENYSYNEVNTNRYVEDIVPVHRTYTPPVTVTPPSYRENSYQQAQTYAPEGRIIHERPRRRKKRPSVVVKSLLYAIMLVAIAIAVIGSGKLVPLFAGSTARYAPIQYLEGQSSVNISNK